MLICTRGRQNGFIVGMDANSKVDLISISRNTMLGQENIGVPHIQLTVLAKKDVCILFHSISYVFEALRKGSYISLLGATVGLQAVWIVCKLCGFL